MVRTKGTRKQPKYLTSRSRAIG